MADFDYDKLADAIRRANGYGYGGGGNAPGGGSSIPGGDILRGWMNFGTDLASATSNFAKSVVRFEGSVTSMVQAVRPLTGLAGQLGNIVQNALEFGAEQGDRMFKQYQIGGNYGAGAGNMVNFNQDIANTRLSLEEFKAVVLENRDLMRALGVTTQDSIENFGYITREITKTDGFMTAMNSAGLSTGQVVRAIAKISQTMDRSAIKQAVIDGTFADLVVGQITQMRILSNQFGRTVEDQQKTQDELSRLPELFAAARQMELSGDPKRAAMLKGEATTTVAGFKSQDMQDAIIQALTRQGGVVTGPAADAINQLNGAALARLQQLGMQFQTGNEAQQRAALESIRTEIPKMLLNRTADDMIRNRVIDRSDPGYKLYQEMIHYFQGVRGQVAETGTYSQRRMDQAVIDQTFGIATREGRGRTPGERDPGAVTTDLFATLKNLNDTLGVAFADQITRANTNLGEFNTKLEQIINNPTLRSPEALLNKIQEIFSSPDFKKMSTEEKFDNLPNILEQVIKDIFPNVGTNVRRADTTFGATGSPYESESNLAALINENNSPGKREGVFSENQIENIVRTALISGDASRTQSPAIGQIGKIATKISDSLSANLDEGSTNGQTTGKTQDDVVEALADLNKTVSELVSLQRQSNKITESGLDKVADANSIYG